MTCKLQRKTISTISDDELLRRLSDLLRHSRRVESELVVHIGEVDERRLYAREASPSMFAYCTEVLHLSEHEAYLRIAVARASRKHLRLLEMLSDGRLHLSGVAKLAPHLTEANRQTLLERAAHKSKRKIEELVAELSPKPDVPATIRKLPARQEKSQPTLGSQLGPDRVPIPPPVPAPVGRAQPTIVEPLAPSRYKVQFTASAELNHKLERLRALMRSSVPDGDLAAIIEEAVTEKLERLESKRFGKTGAPRKNLEETDASPSSRYIPAAVRRAAIERDGSQCTYVDAHGRRCSERDQLEFHHRKPFGRGGDHSSENVQMMCRVHNGYLAERDYGKEAMERYRRLARSRLATTFNDSPKSGSCAREPAPVYSIGNRAVKPAANRAEMQCHSELFAIRAR